MYQQQVTTNQDEANESLEFNFAGSDPTSGVNTEPNDVENHEQFFINQPLLQRKESAAFLPPHH